MRRLLIAVLCCLLLTVSVSAAGSVTDLQSSTLVADNGSCEVTLTIQLTLDAVPAKLSFPLPPAARDITVNGKSARTSLTQNARRVDLTDVVASAGTHTLVIHYDLPDAVVDEKGQLFLVIDLLSGFAFPVERMRFTVTLPGSPEKKASFVSTYMQESVETVMLYEVNGNTISCDLATRLNDNESLTMRLAVSEEMFPQSVAKKWSLGRDDILMYLCALLALLYWALTMRCMPPRRIRRATEPDGVTAGELGCCLCGLGVDFTLMVISWARMGYLLIHVSDSGRVLLHKRMDMGNERSEFEVKHFRILFGRRSTVDATGFHYARILHKASRSVPRVRNYYRKGSGNPMVFRALATGIGFMGGICLATAFAQDTAWRIILSILLAPAGTFAAWKIQAAAPAFLLRQKQPVFIALGCSLVWLLLCLWARELPVAFFILMTQWLAGLAWAFGGRRTDLGRQIFAEVLGLRRHMRTASKDDLLRALKGNPDYFYSLAPYALALGVDKTFADRFGGKQLPPCPWLTTGMDGHMTAREWNRLLRETVTTLDERQQRLRWEARMGR